MKTGDLVNIAKLAAMVGAGYFAYKAVTKTVAKIDAGMAAVDSAVDSVKQTAAETVETVSNAVNSAVEYVADIPKKIENFASGIPDTITDLVPDALKPLTEEQKFEKNQTAIRRFEINQMNAEAKNAAKQTDSLRQQMMVIDRAIEAGEKPSVLDSFLYSLQRIARK